ncbi:MAG: 2-C-methyl-D-erythritol 4-phosphate cytidylyltransferase [Ruminococcaceae bacterium]|nr:2-C-methyl-D-erythritol 4-phosphate cytidylyltransferase [Oscillospiraceae bacterium]
MKAKNLFIKMSGAIASALKDHKCAAIITAAGSSTRMNGLSKQLIEINGKTVLQYSIEAFCACAEVKQIVISAKPEEKAIIESIVQKGDFSVPIKVVCGGSTRQESVKNAFFAIDCSCDYVAIHDGARPMIRPEDISLLFKSAFRYRCATAGHPVSDTVKRLDKNGFINEDVDREGLFAVQTPQVFYCDIYRAALGAAEKSGISVTDDNSLVTAAGFAVKLVDIHNKNLKITTPEDLDIVRASLKKEELQ